MVKRISVSDRVLFKKIFMDLFMTALGLRCWVCFLQLRRLGAALWAWCLGFSLQWDSLVMEHFSCCGAQA